MQEVGYITHLIYTVWLVILNELFNAHSSYMTSIGVHEMSVP